MKVVVKSSVFSLITPKIRLFYVLLASAQLTVSCGWLHEKIGTPDPQLSPVAAGALAGAAVGTGMGLAIGASSGHAGEGVLVGSLAGAATGGAIGYAVDRQKTEKKKGLVQEQEGVIDGQRREIETLKKNRDDISSSKKSSAATKASSDRAMLAKNYQGNKKATAYMREGYRGHPRAVPFNTTVVSDKKAAKLEAKKGYAKLAKVEESEKKTLKSLDKSTSKKSIVSDVGKITKSQEEMVLQQSAKMKEESSDLIKNSTYDSLPPAQTVVSNTARGTIDFQGKNTATVIEKTEAAPEAQVANVTTATVPQIETIPKAQEIVAKRSPQDPACANAEQEANRARRSSSDADRLFYLRRAARLCPNFSGYQIEIGQIYSQIGRKEDARFAFIKALEIEPENTEAKEYLSVMGQ